MTHEEWMAMMKKRYDQFGNGFIDGHFDILRDKYKFESYVLDENGNRWFIYELAVRDKKYNNLFHCPLQCFLYRRINETLN